MKSSAQGGAAAGSAQKGAASSAPSLATDDPPPGTMSERTSVAAPGSLPALEPRSAQSTVPAASRACRSQWVAVVLLSLTGWLARSTTTGRPSNAARAPPSWCCSRLLQLTLASRLALPLSPLLPPMSQLPPVALFFVMASVLLLALVPPLLPTPQQTRGSAATDMSVSRPAATPVPVDALLPMPASLPALAPVPVSCHSCDASAAAE
eukprot:364487-Chlamydomonas_euryale.AAC.5